MHFCLLFHSQTSETSKQTAGCQQSNRMLFVYYLTISSKTRVRLFLLKRIIHENVCCWLMLIKESFICVSRQSNKWTIQQSKAWQPSTAIFSLLLTFKQHTLAVISSTVTATFKTNTQIILRDNFLCTRRPWKSNQIFAADLNKSPLIHGRP